MDFIKEFNKKKQMHHYYMACFTHDNTLLEQTEKIILDYLDKTNIVSKKVYTLYTPSKDVMKKRNVDIYWKKICDGYICSLFSYDETHLKNIQRLLHEI